MKREEVERVKQFYLRCALRCYVAGVIPKEVDSTSGVKRYRDSELGLVYIDEYRTVGDYSFGNTIIYKAAARNRILWQMQYQGWCRDDDPRIISFLKAALKETYSNGVWNFGRGPTNFTDDRWRGLEYSVEGWDSQSFEQFQCGELIRDQKHEKKPVVFWHRLHGMLLDHVEE